MPPGDGKPAVRGIVPLLLVEAAGDIAAELAKPEECQAYRERIPGLRPGLQGLRLHSTGRFRKHPGWKGSSACFLEVPVGDREVKSGHHFTASTRRPSQKGIRRAGKHPMAGRWLDEADGLTEAAEIPTLGSLDLVMAELFQHMKLRL